MNPEKCAPVVELVPVGRPFHTFENNCPVLAQKCEEITTFPNIIRVFQKGPDLVVEEPYKRVREVVKTIVSE